MAFNKVLIVDDEQIFRVLLREILSDVPDIEVVGEASGAQESIDMADELAPDVVLMDVELNSRMNGIEAGKVIKRRRPRTGIVLFSAHKSSDFVVNAAGWSYLLKNNVSDVATLVHAINGASWGLKIIDPEIEEELESKNDDLVGNTEEALASISRTIEELGLSKDKKAGSATKPEKYYDSPSVTGGYIVRTTSPIEVLTPEQRSKVIQFTLEGYKDEVIADDLLVNVTQVKDWRQLISNELGIEQVSGADEKVLFIEGYLRYAKQFRSFESDTEIVQKSSKLLDIHNIPEECKAILKLVVQGLSNDDIALKLNISKTLVEEYLRIIYSILGISSNSQFDPRMVATRVYMEQVIGSLA